MMIDIITNEKNVCWCGSHFAVHYAFNMGIAVNPLCFKCLVALTERE